MNQYLVGCRTSGSAAIIDSGDDEPERWVASAAAEGLTIEHLLQTHGHIDHVAGLAATKRLLPAAPIRMSELDLFLLDRAVEQGEMFGMPIEVPPHPDEFLDTADELAVGELTFKVLHTPGHSPGHVCFYEASQGLLFGGDLIFQGSIGRTDLPGADMADMLASLREISKLPGPTRIFPGHMGETTIDIERASNPYLQGL
eukprot:g2771.t1